MKNLFIVFLLTISYSNHFIAQSTWQQLNSGVTVYLRDISFISNDIGWVVGHNGTILKTNDGGNT